MNKHTEGAIITAQDQEPSHYARIPKMATVDLDPYELALYCHYKQTASDHGTCYKSNTTLANETGMSIRKIQDTRQSLEEKGFVSISYKRDEMGNINSPPTITICNIWAKNYARYHAGGMHLMQGGMQDVHGGYAPDAPKEELIKEELIKENTRKRVGVDFSHLIHDALIDAYYDTTSAVVQKRHTVKRRSMVGQLTRFNIQAAHIAEYLTQSRQDDKWRNGAYPSFDEMCNKIVAWYEHRAKNKPALVPTNGTTAAALTPIIPDVMDGYIEMPQKQYEGEF